MTFSKATGKLKSTDCVIIYGQTYSSAEFLYCGSLAGMKEEFRQDMEKRHVIACWIFDAVINFLVSDFPSRGFVPKREYEVFKAINEDFIKKEKYKTY